MQKNSAERKRKKFYKKWWFFLVIAFAFIGVVLGCSGGNDEVVGEPAAVEAEESDSSADPDSSPVFSFSVEEWGDRLNSFLAEVDQPPYKELVRDEETFKVTLTQYAGFLGQINENQEIVSVGMFGAGDGTAVSGIDIIIGLGALVATVNPGYTPEQRKEVLTELGIFDDVMPEDSKLTKDGVDYLFLRTEEMGIMLFAYPEE